ncbi:hypothetical protein [Lactobacillus sp. ESL0259]|uniref:hypothetical protein n=1 Tax=Lactobacillus sp. ESL0259 TaxID=2069346 RepID=UPI000EFAFC3C|nr:hypothetical protein [Lactobacillus sp. ESL0259]MCT6889419.1 hypothetical protein [Lactobacillus sp.]RMC61756.1 hypothetical protein F5ESL0259_03215 [Lactobacillus sp. ESL0259]
MKDELVTVSLDNAVVKNAKFNLEKYGISVGKYLQLMVLLAAENKTELKQIMLDKNDLTQWLKRLDAD